MLPCLPKVLWLNVVRVHRETVGRLSIEYKVYGLELGSRLSDGLPLLRSKADLTLSRLSLELLLSKVLFKLIFD